MADKYYYVRKRNGMHHRMLQILKQEKKPMSPIQILEKLNRTRRIHGKSPDASIRALLQRSKHIEKVGRGYYRLKYGIKFPKI